MNKTDNNYETKPFNTESQSLEMNNKLIVDSKPKSFRCSDCQLGFKTGFKLIEHLKTVHSIVFSVKTDQKPIELSEIPKTTEFIKVFETSDPSSEDNKCFDEVITGLESDLNPDGEDMSLTAESMSESFGTDMAYEVKTEQIEDCMQTENTTCAADNRPKYSHPIIFDTSVLKPSKQLLQSTPNLILVHAPNTVPPRPALTPKPIDCQLITETIDKSFIQSFCAKKSDQELIKEFDAKTNYECSLDMCGFKCFTYDVWLRHQTMHERTGDFVLNTRQTYTKRELKELEEKKYNFDKEMEIKMLSKQLNSQPINGKQSFFSSNDKQTFNTIEKTVNSDPKSAQLPQTPIITAQRGINLSDFFTEDTYKALELQNQTIKIVRIFQCKTCPVKTGSNKELLAHYEWCHPRGRAPVLHECSQTQMCGFTTLDESQWKAHVLSHEREGIVVWNVRKMYYKKDMKAFRKRSHELIGIRREKQELEKCFRPKYRKECVFPDRVESDRAGSKWMSYKEYHLSSFSLPVLKCMHCSYSIKLDDENSQRMRTHMKEIHPQYLPLFEKTISALKLNAQTVFECFDCNQFFESKTLVESHIRTYHMDCDFETHKCNSCDYTTLSSIELIAHEATHDWSHIIDLRGDQHWYKLFIKPTADPSANSAESAANEDTDNSEAVDDSSETSDTFEVELPVEQPVPKKFAFNCIHEECSRGFDREIQFVKHVRNYHKNFDCDKCSERLKSIQLLNAHLYRTHREFVIRCQSCDYYTFWGCFLDRHIRKHHKKVWLNCPYANCATRMRYQNGIEKHVNKCHKKVKPFECQNCENKYYCKQQLTRHMAGVHRKAVYACDECEWRTHIRGGVKKHKQLRHSEHTFKCTQSDCNYETKTKGTFRAHMIQRHSSRFECTWPTCQRRYPDRKSLLKHLIRHKSCAFMCDIANCYVVCKTKELLSAHKRSVHKKRTTGPIVCDFPGCGQQFYGSGGFSSHRRFIHKSVSDSNSA